MYTNEKVYSKILFDGFIRIYLDDEELFAIGFRR